MCCALPARSGERAAPTVPRRRSGSEEAILAVFEQHPELADICPADGRTMLHQAAGKGALRWMKWLLDRGADVNRNSHNGWTPLDYAATGQGGPWVFDNQKFER